MKQSRIEAGVVHGLADGEAGRGEGEGCFIALAHVRALRRAGLLP